MATKPRLSDSLPDHSSPALWKMFAPASDVSGTRPPIPYPNPSGGNWVVERTTARLGISTYKLGHLLGCEPDIAYKWTYGIQTPSAFYLVRIFKLWDLADKGMDFTQVKRINWDTVTPIYIPKPE